jgi:hypothetical protein
MIFEPMVLSAQTVHLSCIMISTINSWTESTFQFSLVSFEYHRVRPNQFLGLWSIWRKPCTYLAPTLTMSPYRPKRDSTSPTSPRSSIECVQNDFLSLWYVPHEPHHLIVPLGASKTISKPMVRLAQIVHLSWVTINNISKQNETSIHMSLVT